MDRISPDRTPGACRIMIDSIPVWFALIVGAGAWVMYIRLEFRASRRYYSTHAASDPVVVTGSGHRSNRYPRSCGVVR